MEDKMVLNSPVIFANRVGKVPKYQNILNSTVGFLKFSDFGSTNGKIHYEMLQHGDVYFPTIGTFQDLLLTDAQRAVEGSTEWVSWFYGEVSQQARCYVDTTLGNYSIQVPKAVCFLPDGGIKTELVPILPEHLNPSKLDRLVNGGLNKDYDFVIYPNRFIKRKDVIYNGKSYWNYEFDKFKILFTDFYKGCTWRICCFTRITTDNIASSGRLKKEFIKALLSDSDRGSIALDSSNNFRPWVFISKEDMEKSLKSYPSLSYGEVHYYDNKKNHYPYSLNDLISIPDKLLFEKDSTYRNQQEFRLVSGGPNDSFPEMSNPLINLKWLEPKSGITLDELENLVLK